MNVINFGSEDDKIGLGFDMFNTSRKKELTYEDFYKSYKELLVNWSLLLGEKLQISSEAIERTFAKLDRSKRGVIRKEE